MISQSDLISGYYFCGGFYGEGVDKEFRAVSSTGSDPYVATQSSAIDLFRSCSHHSNLYRITGTGCAERVLGTFGDTQHSISIPSHVEKALRRTMSTLTTIQLDPLPAGRYFCGSFIGDAKHLSFDAVCPTTTKTPYVVDENNASILCQHHVLYANLYRLTEAGTAELVFGTCGLDLSKTFPLQRTLVDTLATAGLWNLI